MVGLLHGGTLPSRDLFRYWLAYQRSARGFENRLAKKYDESVGGRFADGGFDSDTTDEDDRTTGEGWKTYI
jgi:hypothetical protein